MSRQVENIIKTVIETTEILIKNPDDYKVQEERFAWAATNALNGTTTCWNIWFFFSKSLFYRARTFSALQCTSSGAGLSVVIPAWAKWILIKKIEVSVY